MSGVEQSGVEQNGTEWNKNNKNKNKGKMRYHHRPLGLELDKLLFDLEEDKGDDGGLLEDEPSFGLGLSSHGGG